MNPEEKLTPKVDASELPQTSSIPIYRKKKIIMLFVLVLVVFIFIGSFLFFKSSTTNEEIIAVISPTPVSVLMQEKTWQVNLTYNQLTKTFLIESFTLNANGQKQDYSKLNSPYSFTVFDSNGKIMYFSKIPVATRVIVPKQFIGTPLEASLKSEPIENFFQVPYFNDALSFQITRENEIILQGNFPKDAELQSASIQEAKSLGKDEIQLLTKSTQSTGSDGWFISATSICSDGKVYIKYDFNTTTPAVIFTEDVIDKNTISKASNLNQIDDSSWQGKGSALKLVGGAGTYTAKANLINWDYAKSPQLIYNGPVGFLKGRTYLGSIQRSGDWTDECVEKGDAGCVEGDMPELGYAETTVTTLSEAICPDVAVSPEPTGDQDQNFLQTCEPESKCESSTETLQICTFTCK